ncbi:hypothetical protein DSO57_1023904, partial [Entomophthora muscae]
MNTFFLVFFPLTWTLANKIKSIVPFTLNRAVSLNYSISGLAAKGKGIIATFPETNIPFQKILSGKEYKVNKVQFDSREI